MKGLFYLLPGLLLIMNPGPVLAGDPLLKDPVFIRDLVLIEDSVFTGDPVFAWIREGDAEGIEQYLQEKDVNARYGKSGMTLLIYSILHGKKSTTALLIEKGADVNLLVDGVSPLMYAAGGDELKTVSALILAGADLEAMDRAGNTALFYAASGGNLRITKYLVRHGANLSHKNFVWETAYDMAVKQSWHEVASYLRSQYERNLPDLLDGPYITWKKKILKAFYIKHDAKSQITRKAKSRFKAESNPYLMRGFAGDSMDYLIYHRVEPPPDRLEEAERIMVIGDIHGGYDSLVNFLQQNGVIDGSLNWVWGQNHLVLVGDIFDRGDKVTEALWLIYRIENQALMAGGAVHLILGNHEVMVLSGNMNYVSNKYRLLTSRLNINYSTLFSRRTVLGQWLRSRNTLVRINDNLFVHAGLSPEVLNSGLTLHEINEQVRYLFNLPERHTGDIDRNTLLGPRGPFWYRGYLEDNHEYQHLPDDEFEAILEYFDVHSIFVGHTNVKEITPLYNNRVFAIDVPFYTYGYPIQGLLIEGKALYLLNSSAEKEKIR